MATISERVTTHCVYLVGVSLSLPPLRSLVPFPSLPPVPMARGTRRWVPPFCARIVTPSARSPAPSRGAVLQCLATPGHCYQYCYYYRYCCRLRPSGEWKSRGPVEPAATSSVALEANYTPSPLLPPWSAYRSFYPTSPFPSVFPKSFDLSGYVHGKKTCRRNPHYPSLIITFFTVTRWRILITRAVSELYTKILLNYPNACDVCRHDRRKCLRLRKQHTNGARNIVSHEVMLDKRMREATREERRQEDRARFSYANNNHNNGFAYHRALAPLRSHPPILRSATPWRARQERDRIPWSRGRAQRRANTSLPPFSRSIGTDERRETKRSTAQRDD